MQFDVGYGAGGGVEKFGGKGFSDRVIALLLPAGDEIVIFFRNHAVQLGNLLGTVLQVGVHCDDDLAARGLEARLQGGGFAIVAGEAHPAHVGISER